MQVSVCLLFNRLKVVHKLNMEKSIQQVKKKFFWLINLTKTRIGKFESIFPK
jgi:hypothetical protein